ncbi:roadblock/LC7 domain-containing protein [Streptomyces sp. NPDC088789]|uniref:roadblock/LC7 domain-containing protein n=1 Tax=Streptomyces sp. NPDC088789 TaxID=3365899 RepID=UPI0038250377
MTSQDFATTRLQDLTWLLEQFAAEIQHSTRAALVSRDGLVRCATKSLDREDRERVAAASSTVLSGCRALAEAYGSDSTRETRQIVIERHDCMIYTMAAGQGSLLTVLTGPGADPGIVSHTMCLLVQQVGRHLATPDRAEGE